MSDSSLIFEIILGFFFGMLGPVSFVGHFKYNEIKQATDDFRRVLYSNAHGTAYRAVLHGRRFALVKDVRDCDQEEEVFYREVQLIGRLHHRHILLLAGFSTGRKRCGTYIIYYFFLQENIISFHDIKSLSSKKMVFSFKK